MAGRWSGELKSGRICHTLVGRKGAADGGGAAGVTVESVVFDWQLSTVVAVLWAGGRGNCIMASARTSRAFAYMRMELAISPTVLANGCQVV